MEKLNSYVLGTNDPIRYGMYKKIFDRVAGDDYGLDFHETRREHDGIIFYEGKWTFVVHTADSKIKKLRYLAKTTNFPNWDLDHALKNYEEVLKNERND